MVAFKRKYLFGLNFYGQEDDVAPIDIEMEAEESYRAGNNSKERGTAVESVGGSGRVNCKKRVSSYFSPTCIRTHSGSDLNTSAIYTQHTITTNPQTYHPPSKIYTTNAASIISGSNEVTMSIIPIEPHHTIKAVPKSANPMLPHHR